MLCSHRETKALMLCEGYGLHVAIVLFDKWHLLPDAAEKQSQPDPFLLNKGKNNVDG